MLLAKVRGTVVSTCKEPSLSGVKFLLVQLISDTGEPLPDYEVAADVVGAGPGEWVLITRGSGAREHQLSRSPSRCSGHCDRRYSFAEFRHTL